MKIDEKKTAVLCKLHEILSEIDNLDKLEIVTQLCLKLWIMGLNDKEKFMDAMSEMYDLLEENANALGVI